MSAFKRKSKSAPGDSRPAGPAPGVKVSAYNGTHLLSTGVASLDDLLGGGLPIHSLLLLEEDAVSSYARLLLKFWIAQGLCCSQPVALVASDYDAAGGCRAIAQSLMAVEGDDEPASQRKGDSDDEDHQAGSTESMRIAFRYEGLKKYQTTVKDKPAPVCRLALLSRVCR